MRGWVESQQALTSKSCGICNQGWDKGNAETTAMKRCDDGRVASTAMKGCDDGRVASTAT